MGSTQVRVWVSLHTHAIWWCLVDSVYAEIDVQLVGLVKTLIDPENIMTDAAAVVSHVTITWLSHDAFITAFLRLTLANCGEIIIHETFLQALNASTDGSTYGTDRFWASQQRYKKKSQFNCFRLLYSRKIWLEIKIGSVDGHSS